MPRTWERSPRTANANNEPRVQTGVGEMGIIAAHVGRESSACGLGDKRNSTRQVAIRGGEGGKAGNVAWCGGWWVQVCGYRRKVWQPSQTVHKTNRAVKARELVVTQPYQGQVIALGVVGGEGVGGRLYGNVIGWE